eukprot:161322_1
MLTLTQLLALSSCSSFVSQASSCNSVNFSSSNPMNMPVTIPINECFTKDLNDHTDVNSGKLVCMDNIGRLAMYTGSADCSGTPSSFEDPCYWGIFTNDHECVSTSTCNSSPCSFALLEFWEGVTQCGAEPGDVVQYTNHTIFPFVMDTCPIRASSDSIVRPRCESTASGDSYVVDIFDYWDSGGSCSGTPIASFTQQSECDAASGTAAMIQCNQVSVATPMPTAPTMIVTNAPTTPAPTSMRTDMPTAPTTASSKSCNSVEISDVSVIHASTRIALPMDVCVTRDLGDHTDVNSAKPVCINGIGRLEMYAGSTDCSGTSSLEDPCHFDWGMDECDSTSTCDSEPCSYASLEFWEEVSQCDGDVPAPDQYVNHTIMGVITDTCERFLDDSMSFKYSCVSNATNGDSLTVDWWMASDCVGTSDASIDFFETGCDVANGEAAIVQCAQVYGPTTAEPTVAPTAADGAANEYVPKKFQKYFILSLLFSVAFFA